MDRIQPSLAIRVLEVLKNLFDVENCIFIIAVDYEVIVRGLKAKFGEYNDEDESIYRSYFDKLIQLPFVMPTNKYNISDYVMQSLLDIGYFVNIKTINNTDKDKILKIIMNTVGNNPRSIKRLMNSVKLSKIFDACNENILTNNSLKIINLLFIGMQLTYPQIYSIFELYPDYKKWKPEYFQHLIKRDTMDEKTFYELDYKQIIYHIAVNNSALEKKTGLLVSFMNFLDEVLEFDEYINISNISKVISLSALTNLSYSTQDDTFLYDGYAYNKSSQTQYKQGSKLIDMIELKNNSYVLDVGCGNGKTSTELYKKNPTIKIDAFDLSKSQISIAIKNRDQQGISDKEVNFFVKDALSINFNNKYDLIFSNATLHWITNPLKMYKLLFGALKKGGQLAVHQGGYKSYYGLHEAVQKAISNLKFDAYYIDWNYPIYYPKKIEMEELLYKVGFVDVTVESIISDGSEYDNLIDNFRHASLLPYLDKLPTDDLKDKLINKYYDICSNDEIDTYTHRLYIFGEKG